MWKGELKMPEAKKDDPGAQMGEAMVKMFTAGLKLEFPDEGHFKLTLMGMPMEGDVERNGDSLTLKPMRLMGMTPEEAKKASKNSSAMSDDFSKPIEGTISADGGTIVLKGKKAEEGEMVFVRGTADTDPGSGAQSASTKSTVTSEESAWVGRYKADPATLDESKLTDEQKADLPMVKAALSTATVDLRADNTFTMTMMLDFEGDWKIENGLVRLNPTKAMGMEAGKDSKNDPILFELRDGKLWAQPKKPGDPTFAFTKG